MRIEQQPAYVLHARPYRETSLLLECLSRDHGRLGVVARGVRRARARTSRAQLEPFRPLLLDLLLKGELATLAAAEDAGLPARLHGDAGLAGLYLNELVVRFTSRQDPHPALFDAYARTLARLAADEAPGWPLRRFERDLLEAVGYGLQLDAEAGSGLPLAADGWYVYQVEHGPVRCPPGRAHALRGADLLAFAQDRRPAPEADLALRAMMREAIRHHLGGEPRTWQMLAAMARR
ncbi:DNA repair protein RecO [Fulvimonas soli]|jgi:DNA repair protein RecO (recombination protein O)|uniref:DNA repair protein RecO n=1 Tax=Fulvimonas soli TaxID=155197 RepID=A0A316IIX1_9GAMM|nr:DNA repair protein RecO [Fulvimonas soli]PWK93043.1 DNA replication and repair protein RecO [Fulvimonas soli]TNY26383.1 DNA repair protein RecO [Fulvimonas soli]